MSAGEGAPQAACAMPMAIIVDDRLDVSSHTLLRFRVQFLHTRHQSQTRESVLHFEASLLMRLAFDLFWYCDS